MHFIYMCNTFYIFDWQFYVSAVQSKDTIKADQKVFRQGTFWFDNLLIRNSESALLIFHDWGQVLLLLIKHSFFSSIPHAPPPPWQQQKSWPGWRLDMQVILSTIRALLSFLPGRELLKQWRCKEWPLVRLLNLCCWVCASHWTCNWLGVCEWVSGWEWGWSWERG